MNTLALEKCFSLVLALCFASALKAGAGGSPTTIFETLQRDGVLNITIETDLEALIHDRRRDTYQPAVMSFKDKNGAMVRKDIEVVPRGKYRRRVCDFPPVKIKFQKKELLAAGLKKHNNLKLTTHCLNDRDRGNYNVFKEYLAYKLYNELTPHSFRVQLVRVTYVDTQGQVKKIKRYGFLIEDDEELAERMGGKVFDSLNPDAEQVVSFDETLMATFNYMIGNEDWSMSMVRNLKLIEKEGAVQVIPVAYDFDFSGLVNASYAVPSSDLNQRHIKDRDYLGFDTKPALLRSVLNHLKEKKAVLYHTVSQCKYLPVEERLEIRDYLDTFYRAIDNLPADAVRLPPWRFSGAAVQTAAGSALGGLR